MCIRDRREGFAEALYELRKAKGMTPEQAMGLMDDVLYFGVMMVKTGGADGMAVSYTHLDVYKRQTVRSPS